MLPANMKYTRHEDTSHSTIVMVRYFSCKEGDSGSKFNFFKKYLSVTRFCSCSQFRELSQQSQLWYHFVFKVTFEEDFLPPKIFRGDLTQ